MAKGSINEDYNTKVTREELIAHCSKAGKASVEAKRQRKTLKEELLLLLESDNIQESIALALIKEAMVGNNSGSVTKAFEVIRDTIGEKQSDKLEANLNNEKPFEVNINVVK